jgi:hypothetical protein
LGTGLCGTARLCRPAATTATTVASSGRKAAAETHAPDRHAAIASIAAATATRETATFPPLTPSVNLAREIRDARCLHGLIPIPGFCLRNRAMPGWFA